MALEFGNTGQVLLSNGKKEPALKVCLEQFTDGFYELVSLPAVPEYEQLFKLVEYEVYRLEMIQVYRLDGVLDGESSFNSVMDSFLTS